MDVLNVQRTLKNNVFLMLMGTLANFFRICFVSRVLFLIVLDFIKRQKANKQIFKKWGKRNCLISLNQQTSWYIDQILILLQGNPFLKYKAAIYFHALHGHTLL